jgi:hypothetical protein
MKLKAQNLTNGLSGVGLPPRCDKTSPDKYKRSGLNSQGGTMNESPETPVSAQSQMRNTMTDYHRTKTESSSIYGNAHS